MFLVIFCMCFLSINRYVIQSSSIITKDMIVSAGNQGFRFGRYMTGQHNLLNKTSNISEKVPEKKSVRNSPVKVFQPVLVHFNETRDQPDYLSNNFEHSSGKIFRNKKTEFITKLFPVKNSSNTFEKHDNKSSKFDKSHGGVEKNHTNFVESVNNLETNDSSSFVIKFSCGSNNKCANISHEINEYEDVIKYIVVNDLNPTSSLNPTVSQLFENQLIHPFFDVDGNSYNNNNLEPIQKLIMNKYLTRVNTLKDENLDLLEFFDNFISYLNNIEISKIILKGKISSNGDQKSACVYNDPLTQMEGLCRGSATRRGSNTETERHTGDSSRRIVALQQQQQHQSAINELLLKLKLLLMIPAAALTTVLALALLTSGSALSLSSLAFLLLSLAGRGKTHATNRFQPQPVQHAFYMR